jgi:hypothetical protein
MPENREIIETFNQPLDLDEFKDFEDVVSSMHDHNKLLAVSEKQANSDEEKKEDLIKQVSSAD